MYLYYVFIKQDYYIELNHFTVRYFIFFKNVLDVYNDIFFTY